MAAATAVLLLIGCEQPEIPDPPVAKIAPVANATDSGSKPRLTSAELRRRLGTDERATFRRVGSDIVEAGLAGAGVTSIDALRGLPLRKLDLGFCAAIDNLSALEGMSLNTLILEGTSVADLTPIAGMPLEVLYLQDTPVTDLSVVHDMRLRQLNLKGVNISDVAPFAGMPLSILWMPQTKVRDIGPLTTLSLESLDVQDTPVQDLTPLSHMTSLQRLNIAGSEVTDIRPITGLRLQRIILSPERITDGMAELRENKSLAQIWPSHETQFSAAEFWERFDVGAWSTEDKTLDSSADEPKSADRDTAATDDASKAVEP